MPAKEHVSHVLSARQYGDDELNGIFERAGFMRDKLLGGEEINSPRPYGKNAVATVFYEPSTRTRLSFEAAAEYLHLPILSTENAREFSSAIKGETIEDTVRVLGNYAGTIVMRHHETGAASKAAAVSQVPIINAGDGKGEHPTQSLLDMFTIKDEKGRLSLLNVVIGGDLANGRTARSLAQMLSLFKGNNITFVSTPDLRIGEDIKQHLIEQNTHFSETDNMLQALHDADVVYWTRLQKERLDNSATTSDFALGQTALQAMRQDAIIMHPLPRVDEIAPSVDADPRAVYFRQAENGLYVRMALLDMLLRVA